VAFVELFQYLESTRAKTKLKDMASFEGRTGDYSHVNFFDTKPECNMKSWNRKSTSNKLTKRPLKRCECHMPASREK
jgi:hypothetical protein